jgi:hypothetical protein
VKIALAQPLKDADARIRADALGQPPRTHKVLLRVIMASQDPRAEAIGWLYGEPRGREAAELPDRPGGVRRMA